MPSGYIALIVISCVLAAVLIGAFVTLFLLVRSYLKPEKRSDEDLIVHEKEVKKFSDQWLKEEYVPVWTESRFGYRLKGYFYDFGFAETVVCLHGHNASHISQLKYMELFKKLGYNAFLPDHRYSGSSGGKYITFGAKEKIDAADAINNLKTLRPDVKIAGLFGESMGAATAMLLAPEFPDLGFLIEYCGYANFEGLLSGFLKNKTFRKLGVALIGMVTKAFYGFSPKECDAAEALTKTRCPLLILHSRADQVVAFENALILKGVRPDAETVFFDDSLHARSLCVYPERFESAVFDILERYDRSKQLKSV